MLLWDPVASNTPVTIISVGRPLNSVCFSAGDPYALLCAPELGTACSSRGGGGGSGSSSGENGVGGADLVQIWDLRCGPLCLRGVFLNVVLGRRLYRRASSIAITYRIASALRMCLLLLIAKPSFLSSIGCRVRFLRCFKDFIPAAVATAFGEDPSVPAPHAASMQPPPPQSPQIWSASTWSSDSSSSGPATVRSSVARTPSQVPSWLTTALGSTSAVSPATPLLVRARCRGAKIVCGGSRKVVKPSLWGRLL